MLFSAHGVPKSYIDAGDPYKAQIESCVRLISEKVDALHAGRGEGMKGAAAGAVSYHLSYQSRVGPVEWLRPYTDSKIQELAAKGSKNMVVVPVSFVSEHIETLEEIDMEYRELAEEAGIVNWRRCVCVYSGWKGGTGGGHAVFFFFLEKVYLRLVTVAVFDIGFFFFFLGKECLRGGGEDGEREALR